MPSFERHSRHVVSSVFRALAHAELFLGRWGFRLLALAAFLYYASYYDTGLTLTGERGSNVLIAQRFLAGERPFVDVFPGYNLLWFYPMSAIYAVIGPHWLATRIYFLVMAVATALMGFALVRRVTGQAWLALLAGVFMVLMPGAIFRNYMGFIGVFAMTLLLRAYVLRALDTRRQIAWMVLAGAGMAVCFLIRIEPSLLMSVLWLGLAVVYPIGNRNEFVPRLRTTILGTLGGLLAFAMVHAPFVADSYRRGFGPEFTGQYTRYVGLFRWELAREWAHWTGTKNPTELSAPAAARVGDSARVTGGMPRKSGEHEVSGRDGRRAIAGVSEIFSGGRLYYLAAALWFPVFLAPILLLTATVLLCFSIIRGDDANKTRALVVLTTTGCALSLFPQYFFFRPDSVHLCEFFVPFWPASLCSAWVLLEASGESDSLFARLWNWFVAALVTLLFVVSFNALFGRDGSGSIMSARSSDTLFAAANGVRVKVESAEVSDWEGLRDGVCSHSAPGEYVVTYPYVPIVNVMCDRPTYQWSLYVDNATASPSFPENEGAVLRERKPAVIVINNRAINKTEYSRFKNWASLLYGQISRDYDLAGTYFGDVEVFARRPGNFPGAPENPAR